MNSQELKEVLKSKGNKLAKAAIDLIEGSGSLEELQKMVELGCNQVFVERDPRHPRSRFKTQHVLDACFDTNFGVVSQSESPGVVTTVLGEVHKSEGREQYFKLLLDAGFTAGSNGYRGHLFDGILFECFRSDQTTDVRRSERAQEFARILVDSGRFDIQNFACQRYYWIGNLNNLATIIAFGASPEGPGMVDNALKYIACAPGPGDSHESRADVIRRLIELGATPEASIQRRHDARYRIEAHGLLEKLSAFGVIDIEQSPDYLAYLVKHELVNPLALLAVG